MFTLEQRIAQKIMKVALGRLFDPVYAARIVRLLTARRENILAFIEHGKRMLGDVHLQMWRPDGTPKFDVAFPNLVVTTGLAHIADQMSDQAQSQMSHMAIGTGSTAAAMSDTALVTEIDRNALDSLTPSANTVVYVCTWAAGDGTGLLREASIFNQVAAGTMLCRTVFTGKDKAVGDSMTLTWTHTYN